MRYAHRSLRPLWGLALAAVLLAPLAARAEGQSLSQLDAMDQRLTALEDQLAASEATVAAQRELLADQSTGVHAEGGILGQAAHKLWVHGVVQFGWAYNFNNPVLGAGLTDTNGREIGGFGFKSRMRDHNSFNFDEGRMAVEWAVEKPGDAGAVLEAYFGDEAVQFADTQSLVNAATGIEGVNTLSFSDINDLTGPDNRFLLAQAYVQWMCRCGHFRFGKMAAPFGLQAPTSSANVFLMHTYGFDFDPTFLTGIQFERALGEYLSVIAMVHNGKDQIRDINDNKGLLFALHGEGLGTTAGGQARASANFAYNISSDAVTKGFNSHPRGSTDQREQEINGNLVAFLTDTTQVQLEGSYHWFDLQSIGPNGAPTVSLKNDPTLLSLWAALIQDFNILGKNAFAAGRYEYVQDHNLLFNCSLFGAATISPTSCGGSSVFGSIASGKDTLKVHTLTLAMGYWFAQNLLMRAEYGRTYLNLAGEDGDFGFIQGSNDNSSHLDYLKFAVTYYFGGESGGANQPTSAYQ
ncbi:MAG: outer membrane beta-barrel protein [Myxococcota bacterium]